MTDFEEFKPEDVASVLTLLGVFLTKDWDLEYLRGRLTEIYDREFVDKLLPYRSEDYFDLGYMESINDEELQKHGFHQN